MGKIRNPQYRIVVADSRTKRDGRAIEYIGLYHPKEDPSRIEVNSERAQYWLSVGAQPSEPVLRILEKTGDWQKYKGLPAPPPLLVAAARTDRRARYEAESQAAAGITPPETKPAKRAAKKAAPASAGAAPAAAASAAAASAGPAAPASATPVEAVAAPVEAPPAPVEAAPAAPTPAPAAVSPAPAEPAPVADVPAPAAEAPAQTEESTGADAGTQA
jgi:small subunit ribosomal protein S16